MELGVGGEVGEGQATLAFPDKGLMCGNAPRGLRERECPRPRDQVDC